MCWGGGGGGARGGRGAGGRGCIGMYEGEFIGMVKDECEWVTSRYICLSVPHVLT